MARKRWLSPQEIFDRSVTRLLHRVPGMQDGICYLRNGRRCCVIGQFIPKHRYTPSLETEVGTVLAGDPIDAPKTALHGVLLASRVNVEDQRVRRLLSELRVIHDAHAGRRTFSRQRNVCRALVRVANRFSLTIPGEVTTYAAA